MSDDVVTLEAAGREVAITHPDKVFFSKGGQTKLDLAQYYLRVEEPIMAAMRDRPVLLERYPNGATGKSFFQKRIPDSAPDWLQTTVVATVNGTESNALVAADIAHLLWAVNQGCLGFHVWPYQAADPEHADELRIDLDPQPGVGFEGVCHAALEVRDLCAERGITAYVKTSGSRGLHIYVRLLPRWDSYQVRAAAVVLARELEQRRPDLLTAKWWKEERGQRVFVDFNQNAPHKTVFGAWSVRPRVGAQVSTPIGWDEVDTVMPDDLTIDTVPDRYDRVGDPWAGSADDPQDIGELVAQFDAEIAAGGMDAPWPPVYPKQPHEPDRVAPSRARKKD